MSSSAGPSGGGFREELARRKAAALKASTPAAPTYCHVCDVDRASGAWHPRSVQIPASSEMEGLCATMLDHTGAAPSVHDVRPGQWFLGANFSRDERLHTDQSAGSDSPRAAIASRARAGGRVWLGFDEAMAAHVAPLDRYPERPQRILHAMREIAEDPNGLMARVEAVPPCSTDVVALIRRVHTSAEYADFFASENDAAFAALNLTPGDTHVGSDGSTRRSAAIACGLVVEASKRVCSSRHLALPDSDGAGAPVHRAFCLVRPPGHHCGERPNGFCIINNVVVAARAMADDPLIRAALGREPRIAVLDFDVHHGDGTQQLIEQWNHASDSSEAGAGGHQSRREHLFLSMHRFDGGIFYPGTGAASSCGDSTLLVNIPFNTARKAEPHRIICDDTFAAVAEQAALPLLAAYCPDIVYISCGFDAAEGDPLGGMGAVFGFERFVEHVIRRFPLTPIVCVLEGGYNVEAVAQCTKRVLDTLLLSCDGGIEDHPPLQPCAPPASWLSEASRCDGAIPQASRLNELRDQHAVWAAQTIRDAFATMVATVDAAAMAEDAVPRSDDAQRVYDAIRSSFGALTNVAAA